MANALDTRIQEIVTRAAADIAAAVRSEIGAEIQRVVGITTAAAPVAKRRGRPPGSGKKAAVAAPSKPAAPAPAKPAAKKAAKKAAKGGRRTSEQVARDDARLLEYIKAHPAQRSEQIVKSVGIAKQNVASGLQRLRDSGSVNMKGIKRAATYTAV